MEGNIKKIVCPNCGAEIESNVDKCPNCGYINVEGAEKKYMNDLGEIKDNLQKVEEEPEKALKKGMSKGLKVILWTIGILIVLGGIYAAIVAVELQKSPKLYLTPEDEAFAAAYKEVVGEQLQEAYDNKDIEEMARIFDKAYSEDRVSLWGDPHYETACASSNYLKLKDTIAELDKGKLKKRQAEEITYYCFYFYYRAYGKDAYEIFDPIRDDEVMPLLMERLGYSIEEMEALRDKVMSPPHVNRTAVYKCTKKYFKRYH